MSVKSKCKVQEEFSWQTLKHTGYSRCDELLGATDSVSSYWMLFLHRYSYLWVIVVNEVDICVNHLILYISSWWYILTWWKNMQHKLKLSCISGLFTVDGCSVVMETVQLSSPFLSLYLKTVSGTVMSFLYCLKLTFFTSADCIFCFKKSWKLCEFVKIILLNFQVPSRHIQLEQTSESKMAAALINSCKGCRRYCLLALQTHLCLMKPALNKVLSNFDPWTCLFNVNG